LPDLTALAGNLNLLLIVAFLSFGHRRFAREQLQLIDLFDGDTALCHSFSGIHSLKLRAALDAFVAQAYGLSFDDFAWILRGCADSKGSVNLQNIDVKGFWRVDKAQEPSKRHTTLALEYFRQLLDLGNAEFCRNLLSSQSPTKFADVSWQVQLKTQLKIDASNLERILALAP
jgi:hypothetical protein